MNKTTLIEFPCYFPIKIIGENSALFLKEIEQITYSHFPNIESNAISPRASKGSNYLGVTVTVYAESQETLDAFYRAISKHPQVKMIL